MRLGTGGREKRINMRVQSGYHLDEGQICREGLIVPKPEERGDVTVRQGHEELGHGGKERTLAAVMRSYYWTDRVVTSVVRV